MTQIAPTYKGTQDIKEAAINGIDYAPLLPSKVDLSATEMLYLEK